MIDLNLLFRGGDSFTQYDDKGTASTVGNAGNLNATFTSNWLDLGASLKQVPLDGMDAVFTFPVTSVTTTGAPTNFKWVPKLEFGDDGSTVTGETITGQTLTFTVTSNAATQVTYTKEGTSTSVNLPVTCRLHMPYIPHRYVRLTLTLSFTAGTSPALDSTGVGKLNAWLGYLLGTGSVEPWIDVS